LTPPVTSATINLNTTYVVGAAANPLPQTITIPTSGGSPNPVSITELYSPSDTCSGFPSTIGNHVCYASSGYTLQWLDVTDGTGCTDLTPGPTGNVCTVSIQPEVVALPVGTYYASFVLMSSQQAAVPPATQTISPPAPSLATVNITLTVTNPAVTLGAATNPIAYTSTWSTPAPVAAAADAINVTGAASAAGLAIGALTGNCGWLNMPTLNQTTTPGATLSTSVNAAGYALLVPGTYTCNVPITGTGGVTGTTVAVTMTVNPCPFLSLAVNVGGTTMLQGPPATAAPLIGYFAYLNGNWIFHLDLGYEFILQANQYFTDPANGVLVYDFASGHTWYTSLTSPFPYIYDFNLGAVIYYDPLPQSGATLDRYTHSPRSFYNFATATWFSM